MPAVLLGLIGAQIAVTRSDAVYHRRLWLDEIHTQLLVEDPSLTHAMDALKNGADTNAPALYVVTRAVSWCVGSTGPDVLRGVGFVSVLLGVLGIYAAVRRVYPAEIAAIAAMAAWAHPLITRHAFEARFYGPWFAGAVWFACALNLWDWSPRKLWPGLLIAVTSVFVCTIHYLGIISLAPIVIAHSLAVRTGWRATLARLVPVGAGLVALAACMPLYRGQRGSISVPTWVEPASFPAARDFLTMVFSYYVFAIPVIGFFASRMLDRGRPDESLDGPGEDVSELAGLSGLALLPAGLIAFSFLVQSVLIDRYAIATVACFGPLIAPIVARSHRPIHWAVLVGLILVSTSNLMGTARWFRQTEARRDEAKAEVARLADIPILFRSRSDLYELWWDAPEARDRFYFWDPKDLAGSTSAQDTFERDMARNHERWYGLSRAASLSSLQDHPLVYLYGLDATGVREIERSEVGVRLRPIDPRRGLFEARRTTERVTRLE
jgi:hypothetical protein